MKPHSLFSVSLLALSMGLAPAVWAAADTVVATVNGKNVHERDLDEYARELNLSPEQAQRRDVLLNEYINKELVHQDALKKRLDKRADVKAEIERVRSRVLLNAAVREALAANPVTEDELKQEYQNQLPRLQAPEFKARHILVKTEDEAKAIIQSLDKGGDFAKLAKEKSLDSNGQNGGDLGWFNPGQMVQPFSAAVAAMKKGSYSKAPVQTEFGWHVIQLDDQRIGEAPAFEEIKPQIQNYLQQRHIAAYLEKLRGGAKIDIKGAK